MIDRQFEIWQAQQIENAHWLAKIIELLNEINDNLKTIRERGERGV